VVFAVMNLPMMVTKPPQVTQVCQEIGWWVVVTMFAPQQDVPVISSSPRSAADEDDGTTVEFCLKLAYLPQGTVRAAYELAVWVVGAGWEYLEPAWPFEGREVLQGKSRTWFAGKHGHGGSVSRLG
jgi:hypothetical protein